MVNGAKRWVFTLNNYTQAEVQACSDFAESTDVFYLIFGREEGEGGTPHLQGYFILTAPHTLQWIKARLGDRVHLEVSRGTPAQASDYCKKEGDFEEFGELPEQTQGKRNDWERYRDWLKEQDGQPTEEQIAEAYPSIWGRYRSNAITLAQMYHPVTDMVPDTPFQWQRALGERLGEPADDRKIIFVVDPEGGEGKSWFCRWMLMKLPEETQVIGMGKRDDMAHMVDSHKRIFLINVPRQQMERLQYTILESLKDRLVSSPKYESRMKKMIHQPHVVVFTNELPDMKALTSDRYEFFTFIGQPFLSKEQVEAQTREAEQERLANSMGMT